MKESEWIYPTFSMWNRARRIRERMSQQEAEGREKDDQTIEAGSNERAGTELRWESWQRWDDWTNWTDWNKKPR